MFIIPLSLAHPLSTYVHTGTDDLTLELNLPSPFSGPTTVTFALVTGGSGNTYSGTFDTALQLGQPQAIGVKVNATVTTSDTGKSLQLSGSTSSSFSISSLPSVTFQKFSLSASLTIPSSGSTVINNLAFSGGLAVGSLGSGNGTFSYASQATNFTLDVDATLPAPFKQVF